ncbi:MAG: ATP-binding cassette domain-containing protein [Gammaproteobacteria bacterium]|nr:ATP-binding cassette domain-containing protein [Gammaproteobacteria bacterium]
MVSTTHSLGILQRKLQLSTLAVHDLAVLALQPVSFSVQAAECICLTGPSGAGKSMLLRAIADLIPHGGDACLDELDCSRMKPSQWRKQVGYLPAESHWWSERVGDHFSDADPDVFRQLGFEPQVLNWQVSRLSTGEKQRLALLRLLANQPRALLLDEPTASLDAANVGNAEALILEYSQQQQAPVIWVSHDSAQIQRVADRVLRLEAGVVQEVTP